ncbi:hypothetical protein Rumal_2969 [Ruminococcus albus 7 = DSM 20455]|uniref:Uncharacterized protein n=1 Tax=Ruminococcus albus (strain ATCC 27210 / DSM 20455 / JCM 14654 / NCDO 2250 / 7) TaxID=697329 RepID=E6UJ87_RUMA7|nr:hypothetical protein Rumal_2969 [Ruminococcus albus 7 = DSM 20455]
MGVLKDKRICGVCSDVRGIAYNSHQKRKNGKHTIWRKT